MRSVLKNPIEDKERLYDVLDMVEDIFVSIEEGHDYLESLTKLSHLVGRVMDRAEVVSAFGSTNAEDFAGLLLLESLDVPDDLSREEMIELIEHVMRSRGSEFQLNYWMKCVEDNVGCESDTLSDLIFYPESDELQNASQILETAIALGHPKSGRN